MNTPVRPLRSPLRRTSGTGRRPQRGRNTGRATRTLGGPEARNPLRVGELTFTNTLPFRLGKEWNAEPCPSPRVLAQWADQDRIDAGVLPVVEAWRLEDRFESLGGFGIAVKKAAGSVLLFSRRAWADLDGAAIGVTDQTSTSVQLLKVLTHGRDGYSVTFREGFHGSDDARLVIGDKALSPSPDLTPFDQVYDLGEEWHHWTGGPFVFARWVVRRTVPAYLREELRGSLEESLGTFENKPGAAAAPAARFLKIPVARVSKYLSGFIYRLGDKEEKAEGLFRDLVSGKTSRVGC